MITIRISQLAQLVGVHRNTVSNWIRRGRLKARLTVGKRYVIQEDIFLEFCRQNGIDRKVMASLASAAEDRLPAVAAVPTETLSTRNEVRMSDKPIGSVMVVGGGIAGIQASLDLADSGYYVYMIEKSAGIGGVMAQLDKTFPTNDCAM